MAKEDKEKALKEARTGERARDHFLQEKSIQLVLLDRELKKIEEQYKIIDQYMNNLELTKENLDKLKATKKDGEILASISEGIFVKALAIDNDKVLINVGKGIVLEKNIDEAKQVIDTKITEFSLLKSILGTEAEKIFNEISTIEAEVKKIYKDLS